VVPQVSTTQGRPTILLPLCFVLIVSAIKDAVEDAKRRSAGRSDARCRGPPAARRVVKADAPGRSQREPTRV
jgi:hypothetical protein